MTELAVTALAVVAAVVVGGLVVARLAGRVALGAYVVVPAAAVVALLLGEYEFEGSLPLVAGVLVGLVLGELGVSVARRRHLALGVVTAVATGAALVGAGAIDANDVEPIKTGAYLAAGIGAVIAFVRTGPVPWGRRRVTPPAG